MVAIRKALPLISNSDLSLIVSALTSLTKGRGDYVRIAVAAAAVCLSIIAATHASDADAAMRKPVNIPAEGLGPALRTLAKDRGFQVVYLSDSVDSLQTHGVTGDFTAEEALKHLLTGTGLTYRYLDDKTVTIFPADSLASQAEIATPPATDDGPNGANFAAKEGKKSSSHDFRVAQVDQGASPQSTGVAGNTTPSQDTSKRMQIEEIVVTAQKRNERLQDVPVPVAVINAEALTQNNQLGIQDYYSSIPGLNVTPGVESAQRLSIRGITTGGVSNPTVGVTVDDMPYGSSTGLGGGLGVPDIDPGDLARIEVLRGPQGTLYGASSMGGLLKFVTVDPSTEGLSGRLQAGISGVQNGAELGYDARGSVNIPVSSTLAARASGFTRLEPGYIDNPVLHINGVNEVRVSGGRLAALWRPSDIVSLKLSALYQDARGDGVNDVDKSNAAAVDAGYTGPALGDLQQNYLPGVGAYDRKVQAYSATLTAKLGSADLTVLSGYNINANHSSWDFTYALGQYVGFGVTGAPVFENNQTNKFTQEVRLSAPLGQQVDWLLGLFYTHERSQYEEDILAENPATGARAGEFAGLSFPTTYKEYAVFTDFTIHFTDRFDVQLGGRESEIRQTATEVDAGPYDLAFLGLPSPVLYPEVDTKSSAFTYLVTPRLKLSSELMLYARLASGYRPGGANVAPGVAREYSPDKTQDYELGAKGDFLDHTLSMDASLYYIDWNNIQLSLRNPVNHQAFNGNGGRAKSQGIELSMELRPIAGLIIGGWAAWNDAKLTQALPATSPAVGPDGDRLPDSSRFSGNLSIEQDFPLSSDLNGFVGAAASYIGDREGIFVGPGLTRQNFAGYTKTDLRAGARYNTWTLNVYVNNVTDRRGLLEGGAEYNPPFGYVYIQPRTTGLSAVKTF